MKTLSYGLVALTVALAVLTACGRHAGQGAQNPAAAAKPAGVAAVAVKPESAPAGAAERAAGMTEESESADLPTGLSPIAAAVAANTPASSTPIPSKWVDGQNYATLVPAQPTTAAAGHVEVVEVFWYGCGHCFHLDPTLEDWRKKGKAPYVDFVRVPVMWQEVHKAHARLFYTLQALGKLEQLHAEVFREIHINNNMLVGREPAETEQLQKAFLKSKGISEADFDRTYRSFSVEQWLQKAQELTHRYKVTGVPSMVVNGKYTADVGTAGGEPQLITLINDLAASEHKH
ncbi:MAG TPA: thiol:disulfide interchange protein DsbA/DsbL [Steroidobacteraceae bacterium]|nr:thiol:disulfide interchange protein DsbA/DsbL [Steroidobacteraceae bacterium]